MDARITRKRLGERLTYDWFKIVAVTLVVFLLWAFLYSLVGPKLLQGDELTFYVVTNKYSENEARRFTEKLSASGRLSYGTQSVRYEVIDYGDKTGGTKFNGALMNQEIDMAVFMDNALFDENGDYKDDGLTVYVSDFRYYVDGNGVCAFTDAIAYARAFLTPFFEDLGEGVDSLGEGRILKERVAAEYFLQNKLDNRFKTNEQIDQGVEWEKQRLISYCEETLKLEALLRDHPEYFIYYRRFEQEAEVERQTYRNDPNHEYIYEAEEEAKPYGISLSHFPNASALCKGSDGTTIDDCVLTMLNFKDKNGDLFYETIAAINFFLEEYASK